MFGQYSGTLPPIHNTGRKRKLGDITRFQQAYQEYKKTCEDAGLPVLWPSPLKQAEQMERTKRKRRTRVEMAEYRAGKEAKRDRKKRTSKQKEIRKLNMPWDRLPKS